MDLTGARVGMLVDSPEGWRSITTFHGFVYERLRFADEKEDRRVLQGRLDWLRAHPRGYEPQPYLQLAAVYRAAGREREARMIALERLRHRRTTLRWPTRLFSVLFDITTGYGYYTWLALVWLVVLAAFGTWVFARAYAAGLLVTLGSTQPQFNALVYAFDVLVPIMDLGQQSFRIPQTGSPAHLATIWYWTSIVLGWGLTTAVVAGLSAGLNRD